MRGFKKLEKTITRKHNSQAGRLPLNTASASRKMKVWPGAWSPGRYLAVSILAALCLAPMLIRAQDASTDATLSPPNQWVVLPERKIVIPEPWDNGRHTGVNSYGSHVYCDKLGEVLCMDGYTTLPGGKATPNNYSASLYGYNPDTGVYRLIKRSNWHEGGRSGGKKGSYPLDENRNDPTPCPRHTYNGICYSRDTEQFYVINGANGGLYRKHPKWDVNNGTDTYTFWAYDFDSGKWTQLDYPEVKRREPYNTVLRAMPGKHKLYLIQEWSLWSYDTRENQWSAEIPKGRSGIGSGIRGCQAAVDPKRERILILNDAPNVRKGKPVAAVNKFVSMRYYDVATKTFVKIPTINLVEGRRKAGLAYVDSMDCYAVRTKKGLFLYFPETGEWKRPRVGDNPPAGKWPSMVYDRQRDMLIQVYDRQRDLFMKGSRALRFDPGTLRMEALTGP